MTWMWCVVLTTPKSFFVCFLKSWLYCSLMHTYTLISVLFRLFGNSSTQIGINDTLVNTLDVAIWKCDWEALDNKTVQLGCRPSLYLVVLEHGLSGTENCLPSHIFARVLAGAGGTRGSREFLSRPGHVHSGRAFTCPPVLTAWRTFFSVGEESFGNYVSCLKFTKWKKLQSWFKMVYKMCCFA